MINISNTKVKQRKRRKYNPELVKSIQLAQKNKPWINLARILSSPRRKKISINLNSINQQTSSGDTVIIPGTVLSSGELTKKIDICAINISDSAKEKLKDTKSKFKFISEEIENNKKAEGVKILTK